MRIRTNAKLLKILPKKFLTKKTVHEVPLLPMWYATQFIFKGCFFCSLAEELGMSGPQQQWWRNSSRQLLCSCG